jgi:hypothetical protein
MVWIVSRFSFYRLRGHAYFQFFSMWDIKTLETQHKH